MGVGVDIGHNDHIVPEILILLRKYLLDLIDEIRGCPELFSSHFDLGPGIFIILIGISAAFACIVFNVHRVTVSDELRNC